MSKMVKRDLFEEVAAEQTLNELREQVCKEMTESIQGERQLKQSE